MNAVTADARLEQRVTDESLYRKVCWDAIHQRGARTPNDPKLSDGGAWRGACPTVERTADATNVSGAPLAESTRRDTRSRSLQRMVRRCGLSELAPDAPMIYWSGSPMQPYLYTGEKIHNSGEYTERVVPTN